MNVMLENLMLLGIYGIEVVKFVIGTRLVLKEKEQKVWMYLVGFGVAVGYVVWAGGNANSLFIYALVICSTYFSVGGKWFDRLIKVLLLALLVLSLDEIAAGITREFVNRNEIFDKIRFVAIFLDTF